MSKTKKSGQRLVYSTDGGRLCPQCHRPVADCLCGRDRPACSGDGIVRLSRETKGRGGKSVTLVRGVPLAAAELKTLARALKQRCGVGGTARIPGQTRRRLTIFSIFGTFISVKAPFQRLYLRSSLELEPDFSPPSPQLHPLPEIFIN